MAQRSHRTDTNFFIAVILVLIVGFVWSMRAKPAADSTAASSTPTTTTPATVSSQSVTDSNAATSDQTWSGELILVRSNQLVARKADGSERTVYTAPKGSSIATASTVSDGKAIVELSSGTPNILSVDLKTGKTSTPPSTVTTGTLATPRPTTSGIATATFSNAERDFGTTVALTENGSTKTLYKSSDTVTSLAWRLDGDALAIGTQTGVVMVNMASGDTLPTDLKTPVRSLSWNGSNVFAVTAGGTVKEIQPGKSATDVSGFSSISRDFQQLAANQYVWLHDATGAGAVEFTSSDSSKAKELARASRILGVLND